jgi:hypothetical protein
MLIGLFGFYSKWIPWYEERIAHWRYILSKKSPVVASKQEEADKMEAQYGTDCQFMFYYFCRMAATSAYD